MNLLKSFFFCITAGNKLLDFCDIKVLFKSFNKVGRRTLFRGSLKQVFFINYLHNYSPV